MMEKFKGICVGGEADGRTIEAKTPDVSVPRRVPMPDEIPSIVPEVAPLPPYDGYLWTKLSFGSAEFGFWRLSTMAPSAAVAQVFEAYASAPGLVPVSAVYMSWSKDESAGWLAVGSGEVINATHWLPLPPPLKTNKGPGYDAD